MVSTTAVCGHLTAIDTVWLKIGSAKRAVETATCVCEEQRRKEKRHETLEAVFLSLQHSYFITEDTSS